MRTRVLNHFHTFHPDAQAEHDRLAREEQLLTRQIAAQGDEAPKRRMSETLDENARDAIGVALLDIKDRIEEQKAIIASGVVRVVIKGLTRGEFRRLLTAHPPREGDALDAQLGYNSDTFGDALISACIVRTENLDGDPVPNDWPAWADEMTNGQWEEFFTACLRLTNDGEPVFPR
jgi:hypothetical protein